LQVGIRAGEGGTRIFGLHGGDGLILGGMEGDGTNATFSRPDEHLA
jgi:hypothetical protein